MKAKIKIVLAEEHTLIRKSISSLLEDDGLLSVVGEASSLSELLQIIGKTETDVILLDRQLLLRQDNRATIARLRKVSPKIKIIEWCPNADEIKLGNGSENETSIHLTSDCDEKLLFETIHTYCSHTSVKFDLIPKFISKNSQSNTKLKKEDELWVLSQRQLQIVQQICLGKSNQEIADSLFLTASNVDSHKTKIYRKTGCTNAVHLLRFALKHGLIKL